MTRQPTIRQSVVRDNELLLRSRLFSATGATRPVCILDD